MFRADDVVSEPAYHLSQKSQMNLWTLRHYLDHCSCDIGSLDFTDTLGLVVGLCEVLYKALRGSLLIKLKHQVGPVLHPDFGLTMLISQRSFSPPLQENRELGQGWDQVSQECTWCSIVRKVLHKSVYLFDILALL